MVSDNPKLCSRVCGYTFFLVLSVLIGGVQVASAYSRVPVQPEMKMVNTNHFAAKPNQSIESLMSSILNPKVLLTSANDQIHNIPNNTFTFNVNSPNISSFWDSATVLLSHQILPPKDIIPIYTLTQYAIAKGNLSAKLPCYRDFRSIAYIVVGNLTDLKPATMVPVKPLSKPGYMCMYNSYFPSFDILSNVHTKKNITEIFLFNPTSHRIVLLNTSTIIVSVHAYLPPPKTYR